MLIRLRKAHTSQLSIGFMNTCTHKVRKPLIIHIFGMCDVALSSPWNCHYMFSVMIFLLLCCSFGSILYLQIRFIILHLHLHLGFVHPLQDVALHQCLPPSSVCCFPNPGRSLLLCYVILPSSAWSSSRPLPSP